MLKLWNYLPKWNELICLLEGKKVQEQVSDW